MQRSFVFVNEYEYYEYNTVCNKDLYYSTYGKYSITFDHAFNLICLFIRDLRRLLWSFCAHNAVLVKRICQQRTDELKKTRTT